MSNLLDKIVNVSISIQSAVPDSTSFNYMLLIGPAPLQSPEKAPADVGEYLDITEVTEAGWSLTDDPVAKAAMVAFANGAEKVYIAVRKISEGIPEDITDTLSRALENDGWYGVALLDDASAEDTRLASAWIETQEKILGFTTDSLSNPVSAGSMRTFGFYAEKDSKTYNAYTHVACMAVGLGYTSGSETWAYKTLSQISPSVLTSSQITELDKANLNYDIACAGRNITLTGKVCGGEWIDTIRFRDWLHNDMQKKIYNLFVMNPKIPFTNAGIALIENQIIASLKEGQANGGIASTEYDSDGNEIAGFTVSVPNAANVSDSEKAARTLNNCKFTARLAGAIHAVKIVGVLTT